jgi:hypothetical protein
MQNTKIRGPGSLGSRSIGIGLPSNAATAGKVGSVIVNRDFSGGVNREQLIRRYERNYFRGWIVSTKRRGRSYAPSGEARIAVNEV